MLARNCPRSAGARVNYYKRHLGDFARDTAHLSQGQIGAYCMLLDWYYATEKPLPTDPLEIYRITKAKTPEEKKNTAKARTFFDECGRHKRCDEEITAYNIKAARNRQIGKMGGRPGNPNGYNLETQTVISGNPQGTLATSHKPLKEQEQKKKQPQAAFVIPDWIRAEVWEGFAEMRKRKRAPLTTRACAMVITELIKLRSAGHDPCAVLDQSTRNSWTDVYPIKEQGNANSKSSSKLSAVERVEAAINERERERDQQPIQGEIVRITSG